MNHTTSITPTGTRALVAGPHPGVTTGGDRSLSGGQTSLTGGDRSLSGGQTSLSGGDRSLSGGRTCAMWWADFAE
ncbi:hypothetical protein [Prolixibacter bellariivorans]|uniref:hypothetical protein n=1 Tax=Prolixibacter bellariivorans TaxID=314319 RepID=UPI0011DD8C56|nr:hypothetical protein [Prolixibacter bellariivorans]